MSDGTDGGGRGDTEGDAADSDDVTVTVFTPTYRRAETLHRPFESLRDQTFRDFEWLVVDDDSGDGTADLVRGWREEASFPVRLHVQGPDERGKHLAYNRALDLASGRFFLTLDSDDRLEPDALERLLEAWEGIDEDRREGFVGVSALLADGEGNTGGRMPAATFDGTYFDLRYRYGKFGEGVALDRTDVLREYPYPELDGVRYVPESAVRSRIHREYRTRYVDEVLGRYYAESGDDQLTATRNVGDSPAFAHWHAVRLDEHTPWFGRDPVAFLVSAAGFVRHSLHAGDGPLAQFRRLSTPAGRLLWAAGLVPGIAAYLLDRWRER